MSDCGERRREHSNGKKYGNRSEHRRIIRGERQAGVGVMLRGRLTPTFEHVRMLDLVDQPSKRYALNEESGGTRVERALHQRGLVEGGQHQDDGA